MALCCTLSNVSTSLLNWEAQSQTLDPEVCHRAKEQGKIYPVNLLAALLAAFATRTHFWLKAYLMTTKTPHLFLPNYSSASWCSACCGAWSYSCPGAEFDLLNFMSQVSPHHKSILTTPNHLLIPDPFGNGLQDNLPHHLPQEQRCG